MNRKLGWVPKPDIRNKAYPLSLALPEAPAYLPKFKYWSAGPVLDQGETPMCVGFSWKQWMQTKPLRTLDGPSPEFIYNECKKIDELPGVDGTTTKAAVTVMQGEGRVQSYLWATNMDELKAFLLTKGPVCVGTEWTDDMFYTDSKGFVHPSGAAAGGHAYLCIGYSTMRKSFRFINSWGKSWGENGRFWISEEDFAHLLFDRYGEACAAIEQKVTPLEV